MRSIMGGVVERKRGESCRKFIERGGRENDEMNESMKEKNREVQYGVRRTENDGRGKKAEEGFGRY